MINFEQISQQVSSHFLQLGQSSLKVLAALLAAVLIGLVLNRKLPQAHQFWSKCYWALVGIGIVQNILFAPYRIFRVLYDLGRLFQ